MAQSNGLTPKRDEGIPILIPEESILEGYIKTKKSLKIESNFYGTLLSTQKVIIDVNSTVHGDVICAESIISGNFEGNIFCTGKIEVNGNARITGKVYTKLFQNEDTCDLNCIVQVPNNEIFITTLPEHVIISQQHSEISEFPLFHRNDLFRMDRLTSISSGLVS